MLIGTITSRFPNGSVQTSIVYAGPNLETAQQETKRLADACSVETTWSVAVIPDHWQWSALELSRAIDVGYLPPETKEVEKNKE